MSQLKKRLLGALAVSLLAPVSAQATNGYQLIGVGSYQKSLAGAVTANPGSAMAAVSNPAGMARIGSRADFSMEAFMPERSVDFTAFGGGRMDSAAEAYGVPAIGWTAPVGGRSDLYFGGGMYGTSGMGVDYPTVLMLPAAASPFGTDTYWDGYSNISFWQMAPTLAWNVSDRLSVGAALNLDYQSVAFQQRMTDGAGQTLSNFDLARSASAFGFGVSLGLLYEASDRLTVGLAYKSKQVFDDLEYRLGVNDIQNVPGANCPGGSCPAGVYTLGLDYPQQLALGVAFAATDALTVSADVKWINWSATMERLSVEGPDGIRVPMDPGWDDQTVYALGVALAATDRLNLRAGFNYGASPIDAQSAGQNFILPAIVERHYTVGGDYSLDGHWQVGFHYMYVPEKTIVSTGPGSAGAAIALSETSVGVNLGYLF